MQFKKSDPDIETIISRIVRGDVVIDSDYSKNNRWSEIKKQQLIDTIIRDWYVPPVYLVVEENTGRLEVVDGRERLGAIKEFVDGWLRVDGFTSPWDRIVNGLHGCSFNDLPEEFKNSFLRFSIGFVVIDDYSHGESGELFKRLSHRSGLTGAEQRNSYYGPMRSQVKAFVSDLERRGVGKDFLGFSNSRMAYDDVMSRVAILIERGGLDFKITSDDLSSWYSAEDSLADSTVMAMENVLLKLYEVSCVGSVPRFNKSTLVTWLLFLARLITNGLGWVGSNVIHDFMHYFDARLRDAVEPDQYSEDFQQAQVLLEMYRHRSSIKVDEVSSVILRDAAVWVLFFQYVNFVNYYDDLNVDMPSLKALQSLVRENVSIFSSEEEVSKIILTSGWGEFICR